jgi:glycosyltransferase involved in cell wall biosynthesis
MPRVLIISYYFPPAGGPAVHRIMGWVRNLPAFGWDPVVLTVEGGMSASRDEKALADIPPDVPVYRTKTLEPFALYNRLRGKPADFALPIGDVGQNTSGLAGAAARWVRANIFIPDARVGWLPYALPAARQIIKKEHIDAVFTSSPPPSTHLIGYRLAKRTGLPWLADFHDPWTAVYYNENLPRTRWAKALDRHLEQKVVRSATAVSTVSEMFRETLGPTGRRAHIIPNGYEESDFVAPIAPIDEQFQLVYCGNLIPLHKPEPVFDAISSLARENAEFRRTLRLVFVGNVLPGVQEMIGRYGLTDFTDLKGFVPHSEAITWMRKATVLLLISPGHILPSKVFEFLATGRPMLTLAPLEGDVDRLLQSAGREAVVPLGNVAATKLELARLFSAWQANALSAREPMQGVEHLSHRAQAGEIARLLASRPKA